MCVCVFVCVCVCVCVCVGVYVCVFATYYLHDTYREEYCGFLSIFCLCWQFDPSYLANFLLHTEKLPLDVISTKPFFVKWSLNIVSGSPFACPASEKHSPETKNSLLLFLLCLLFLIPIPKITI